MEVERKIHVHCRGLLWATFPAEARDAGAPKTGTSKAIDIRSYPEKLRLAYDAQFTPNSDPA